eukprot:CAMPEP_0184697206 /NCGR_PEP_ID=MMETSP0313-20130426/4236_1 /TAXON_ID=2792 /ORGANISM="Porphyridium aerugineum, Strain SAG 1380-2" /LENGTH=400 /DNA_ID=CAMNT_0027155971 /DNA_START=327 /DNA_END=1529 /DNA_ORIENTATION=-
MSGFVFPVAVDTRASGTTALRVRVPATKTLQTRRMSTRAFLVSQPEDTKPKQEHQQEHQQEQPQLNEKRQPQQQQQPPPQPQEEPEPKMATPIVMMSSINVIPSPGIIPLPCADPVSSRILHVIDFDGTLVWTPGPQEGKEIFKMHTGRDFKHQGWWGRPESLQPPVIQSPTPMAYLNSQIAKVLHQSRYDHSIDAFVLTGRVEKLRPEVERILTDLGLGFLCKDRSKLILKTSSEDTFAFKSKIILQRLLTGKTPLPNAKLAVEQAQPQPQSQPQSQSQSQPAQQQLPPFVTSAPLVSPSIMMNALAATNAGPSLFAPLGSKNFMSLSNVEPVSAVPRNLVLPEFSRVVIWEDREEHVAKFHEILKPQLANMGLDTEIFHVKKPIESDEYLDSNHASMQ